MIITTKSFRRLLVLSTLCVASLASFPIASAQSASSAAAASKTELKPGVIDRTEAATILPKPVFYKGLSATIQGRNSAGIRFPNGDLVLVTMVDTSGYSSAVAQTYQAYLLNEVHLKIGDKVLPPGAYGFGFIGGDQMVVLDIAGNELGRVDSNAEDVTVE